MNLSQLLNAIPVGIEGAAAFERFCIDCFITENEDIGFGQYIYNGKPQETTVDGQRRFDYVAAIKSPWSSPFQLESPWDVFLLDFNSRLIVFEFKNYSGPVTRNEVLLTSKYLSHSAKRSVAILITRSEVGQSAFDEAQSILREHKKLIVAVSILDLIDALENDQDLNALLAERVTDFLMGLNQ